VACIGKKGKRDFVQVGSQSRLGRSHLIAHHHYPGWGDEKRHHRHREGVVWVTIKAPEKEEDKEKLDEVKEEKE